MKSRSAGACRWLNIGTLTEKRRYEICEFQSVRPAHDGSLVINGLFEARFAK